MPPRRATPRSRSRRFSEGEPLPWTDVFPAGVHKGKPYTPADLADIQKNFRRWSLGPQPLVRVPLVVGHEEDQSWTGIPAMGQASAIREIERRCPVCHGAKTVRLEAGPPETCATCHGDGRLRLLQLRFQDVPPEVADLIRSGAYRRVSAEVYDEPPEGVPGSGKMFRRISLTGGMQPQIKSLRDVPRPAKHCEAPRGRPVRLKFSDLRPTAGVATRSRSLAR
jgi:hypothetical protein